MGAVVQAVLGVAYIILAVHHLLQFLALIR